MREVGYRRFTGCRRARLDNYQVKWHIIVQTHAESGLILPFYVGFQAVLDNKQGKMAFHVQKS